MATTSIDDNAADGNSGNLFMPSLVLGTLLLPLASGLLDVRILFLVFFAAAIIAGIAAKIMPLAERMKRVLQMFFGTAFILCNMSLLFYDTKWLQVDGITYSLETSIACEMVLSVLALCALHEWDKIPGNVDIKKVRLCSLQRGIKRILKFVVAVIIVIVLTGYDMGIGTNGMKISFAGENGEQVETGLFTNAAVTLLYQVNKAFQAALSQNVIGTGFALAGIVGAVLAIIFMGICVWLMYRGYCQGFEGKKYFPAIAWAELLQLLLIPVAWELLPMYMLFLYSALKGYMPAMDRIKDCIRHHKMMERV